MRHLLIILAAACCMAGSAHAFTSPLLAGYACKKINPYIRNGHHIKSHKPMADIICTKRGAPTCRMFSRRPGAAPNCQ